MVDRSTKTLSIIAGVHSSSIVTTHKAGSRTLLKGHKIVQAHEKRVQTTIALIITSLSCNLGILRSPTVSDVDDRYSTPITDRSARTRRRYPLELEISVRDRHRSSPDNSYPVYGFYQLGHQTEWYCYAYTGLDAPQATELFVTRLFPLGYQTGAH